MNIITKLSNSTSPSINIENYFIFSNHSLLNYSVFFDYYIILIFTIISILLASLMFILSYLLGTTNSILDVEKLSSYECGFSPIKGARELMDLKFYKTAILFLIFDIEVIFLMPWSVCVLTNSMFTLNYLKCSTPFLMTIFLGIMIEYRDELAKW